MSTLLIALALIGSCACSAVAWKFAMSGEYENRFTWIGRTGNNDLYGTATAQEGAVGGVPVGLAGPNILNTGALPTVASPTSNFLFNLGSATGRQMVITRGGFSSSGSDARINDSRLTLQPTIRVN